MESITYAQLPGRIVVIRVRGKGNHLNSNALRELFKQTAAEAGCSSYLFDMEHCESLDSTFMGIMATMALRQQRTCQSRMIVANLSDHVRELLTMLGLRPILEMRSDSAAHPAAEFAPASGAGQGKIDRLLMMIEAHQQLVDLDGGNEVKFHGVLNTLHESLDRARQG